MSPYNMDKQTMAESPLNIIKANR